MNTTAVGARTNVMLMIDDLVLGGAERQLVELAKGLDKERFDVTVMTLFAGQPLEADLQGQVGITLLSLNRKNKFDFGVVPRLANVLHSRDIHVLQPFLSPATFFAFSAAVRARTPVRIMTERSGLRRDMGFGERLYQIAEDRLGRFVDAAVANSESGRRFLIGRGIPARKTRVIYNGVNEARVTVSPDDVERTREELGIPAGVPVVGMVASLTPAKDWPAFLQAARMVRDDVPDAHFVAVGDGPLRGALEQLTTELRLEDRVRFAGYQLEVAAFIKLFDVAVLTSRDYEGCSNFILEAMGIGTPVVATAIGGNPELVSDAETGWLVPSEDPERMARSIVRVLRSDTEAHHIASRAKETFHASFSIPNMVSQYERLYEELLRAKSLWSLTATGGMTEVFEKEGVRT